MSFSCLVRQPIQSQSPGEIIPKCFLLFCYNHTTGKQAPRFCQRLGKTFQKLRPQSLQEKPGHSTAPCHWTPVRAASLRPCPRKPLPWLCLPPRDAPMPVPRTMPCRMKGLHDVHPLGRRQEDRFTCYLYHIYPLAGGQKESDSLFLK